MPKVDLKLYSTAAVEGSKQTTTISYVNPNSSNAVLLEFAQKLNAFTTNNYAQTDRVETINVDTENSRKQWRDMTAENVSRGSTNATITYNSLSGSTNTPAIFFDDGSSVQSITTTFIQGDTATQGKAKFSVPNNSGTIYAGFAGGTTFYPDYIIVDVT